MVHSLHSLLVSCEEGEAAKVRTILQSGEVGVNSADEAEISGLQVAAANGHIEIVSELLARGANTEHQNSSGWTALQQAAKALAPRRRATALQQVAKATAPRHRR